MINNTEWPNLNERPYDGYSTLRVQDISSLDECSTYNDWGCTRTHEGIQQTRTKASALYEPIDSMVATW